MSSTNQVLAALKPTTSSGGLPLHRQVEERLRRLAAIPDFQDGEMLPDELTIANRLGVSRGTARAALTRLVQEGLLDRKAGVGTRVARKPVESGIAAWRSFTREMKGKGIDVVTFHSECRLRPAPENVSRALQVEPGTSVHRLDRVRGWNGSPVLQSRSWFHPRLRLTGNEDFTQPLYEVIESRAGVIAESAHESFCAVVATATLARRLRVKTGEPLLLRAHTVYDVGGRPIEFAEVHYVSKRFSLTLDLRRGV